MGNQCVTAWNILRFLPFYLTTILKKKYPFINSMFLIERTVDKSNKRTTILSGPYV